MRALLVLATLGWLVSLPWTVWLVFLGVVLFVLVVGGFILRMHDGLPLARRHAAIDPSYVAALEALVAEAESEVATLRAEIDRLRAAAHSKSPDADTSKAAILHGRVGLCVNAPEWLVAAAQRAYRAKLHPDRHPPSVKAEAERRFKTMENIFEAIAAQRASA